MSNLAEFARAELKANGAFDSEVYDGLIGDAVMELVEKFADQGHSGMSAPIVIQLFSKVAKFEPLGPLTGADDEWVEVGPGMFQNKRCFHVFKEAAGDAYDSEGRIFREPNGSCYTNRDSRVFISFPYTPTREYVDVPDRTA